MVDLNKIDLESLPNVDNRLIPQLRKYFTRVMELQGKPLDYKIDTIYNELINGDLQILVSSKDKNSQDYYEEMPRYAIGLFLNQPTFKEKAERKNIKDVSRIFIDEGQVSEEVTLRFPGYEDSTISHEMEHYISFRYDGRNCENNLCDYSIIGEAATEIGNLYNLFNGDEEKIKEVILQEDNTTLHIGYILRVRFLLAINEAAGHNIIELIDANRKNDFDYFCSIIPKKYIEKISLLYEDFFEGKCIDEIGDQQARVLYDAIEQLKNYMYENPEIYPNLSEQTVEQMGSIFKGYETIIQQKNEIYEQLGNHAIFDLDYLDTEMLEQIKTEVSSKFPDATLDEIEYSIFAELLRENPNNMKDNVIMSSYSGYFKFFKILEKVRQNVEQDEFIVRDNFEYFLDEYTYRDGIPTRRNVPLKQEVIYREPKTGKIKCFINGNVLSEEDSFSILLKEDDSIYGTSIDLVGKVMDEDEWKRISELILSQGMDKYVQKSTIADKLKHFKEALKYYSFDEKEELSDEALEFLDIFYGNEEEYEIDEFQKMADVARNALMVKSYESNFASYTSVSHADEEFVRRIERSESEGERI